MAGVEGGADMRDVFRKIVRLGVLSLGLAGFAAAAGAEAQEGIVEWNPWTPSPYWGARVGYLRVEGVDSGSLNVGLLAGYEALEWLAVEGSLDYHTSDYHESGRATWAAQANLRLYPLPFLRRFRPYVAGGIGYYYSDYDLYASESYSPSSAHEDDGGFHLGGGFDVAIPPREDGQDSFVTFDARYLFTHKSEDDPRKIEADGILVTIGYKVRF